MKAGAHTTPTIEHPSNDSHVQLPDPIREFHPIKELRIQQVSGYMTQEELMKLHPTAISYKTDNNQYGVKNYVLADKTGQSMFRFHEGKMWQMEDIYDQISFVQN
jgi:hypothetical protein